MKTIEAVIESDGRLRLPEGLDMPRPRRVLITYFESEEERNAMSAALLSEPALAEDWNRPEEDEAWKHLQ